MTRPAAKENGAADALWQSLHEERSALERALALVQVRRRIAVGSQEAAQVEQEEADLLVNLDRVLTRIRAEEYRRRPGARQW